MYDIVLCKGYVYVLEKGAGEHPWENTKKFYKKPDKKLGKDIRKNMLVQTKFHNNIKQKPPQPLSPKANNDEKRRKSDFSNSILKTKDLDEFEYVKIYDLY